MNGGDLTAVASLGVALIAAAAAVATQRSSARATEKAADTASRSDIEKDAYLNAERFWKGIVSEQDAQIAELKEELASEKRERAADADEFRARLAATERETHAVRADLDAAQRVIRRLRAPDDTDGVPPHPSPTDAGE